MKGWLLLRPLYRHTITGIMGMPVQCAKTSDGVSFAYDAIGEGPLHVCLKIGARNHADTTAGAFRDEIALS